MPEEQNVARYIKLMGNDLFQEIKEGLSDGNRYYALIGPKNIGTGYALRQIKELLEKDHLKTIYLDFSEFGGISFEKFINVIAGEMGVEVSYQSGGVKRLSSYLTDIVESFFKSEQGKTVILVKNITALSISIAHEFLLALSYFHGNDYFGNRLTAIVSGSENFLGMSQGVNSPFRFAEKILIRGGDRELVRKYFKKGLENITISDNSIDYVYDQIAGSNLLLIEIFALMKRERKKSWTKDDLIKILEVKDDIIKNISDSPNFRMMIKNIEHDQDSFNDLIKILDKRDGTLELSRQTETISFLEASGAVWLDANRKAHINPLLRRFFNATFTDLYKGDIFCMLSEWDKGYECYQRCDSAEKYRSVSGEDQFRFVKILIHWENFISRVAKKGYEEVQDIFLKGVQHLLVFDKGVMSIRKKDGSLLLEQFFGFDQDDGTGKKEFKKDIKKYNSVRDAQTKNTTHEYIQLCPNERVVYANMSPADDREGEAHIEIKLERKEIDRRIDTKNFDNIKGYVRRCADHLQYALRQRYKKEWGQIIRTLNNALAGFNEELTATPLTLKNALNKVCEVLVDGFYQRAIICEVNFENTELTHRYEKHRQGLTNLANMLTCDITDPDNPIGKSVGSQKKYIIDIQNEKAINGAIKKHIKGAGIVPMVVEDKVVGVILFERKDQKVPASEEMKLFDQFATQLASIYRFAIRQIMLRDALSVIDDPIILNNVRNEAVFLNERAATMAGFIEKGGWLKTPLDINDKFSPELKKDDDDAKIAFSRRLEQIKERSDGHRIYLPDYNKHEFKSVDWHGNLLFDHQTKNIIGSIERYHDISLMFGLIGVMEKAWEEGDKKKIARVFLDHLTDELGYGGSWIWLIREENGAREFVSFAADSFKDDGKRSAFENQELVIPDNSDYEACWLCVDEKKPIFFIHDESMESGEGRPVKKPERARIILGMDGWKIGHLIHRKILKRRDGDIRIGIPLIGGKDEVIGKIVVDNPPKNFAPIDFQYLMLVAQSAGVAIQTAINRENDLNKIQRVSDEKLILGRMLSHRMSGALTRARMIINELIDDKKEKVPEYFKKRNLQFLKYQTAKTSIIIEYLLSGMEKISAMFEGIRVRDLLESVKESVTLEIESAKNKGSLKEIGWDCQIIIDVEEDLAVTGDGILLWNAIESLVINAVTALKSGKRSGEILLKGYQGAGQVKIGIESNGPGVDEKKFEYMNKIISSSGLKEDLVFIAPFNAGEQGSGHGKNGLGLKLTTWIIKSIHNGDVKLISVHGESPRIEIILKQR